MGVPLGAYLHKMPFSDGRLDQKIQMFRVASSKSPGQVTRSCVKMEDAA